MTFRTVGFTVFFNNYAVVEGEQTVSWFDTEESARFAAQAHVEQRGGSVRVVRVIAQYRAAAEENKDVDAA